MPDDVTDLLRQTNGRLRAAIARLRAEKNPCRTVKAEDLSGLLADLVAAGECLRGLGPGKGVSPEIERERAEYRDNLETLARLLPEIHQRLQIERARLRAAQSHVDAAAAWASAGRGTLCNSR